MSDEMMSTSVGNRATVAESLALLPGPDGEWFVTAMTRGSVEVELYAPRGLDPQSPHTRDELYFVVSGVGEFVNGGERHPFGPGDALFVAAGVEHRFENFTDDLVVWVVFYGPEGGDVSLEMRGSCERCGAALPWDGAAFICSYECTFCEGCAGGMDHVCPNCGGELVPRPRREAS